MGIMSMMRKANISNDDKEEYNLDDEYLPRQEKP